MRYELYTKVTANDQYAYLYVTASDFFETILIYLEDFPVEKHSKYIIIDNDTPNPVNYYQLGLENPPSLEEHQQIVYECKIAKEYRKRIKFEEFDDCYDENEPAFPFENIFASAKYQTERYFEKYNSKSTNK